MRQVVVESFDGLEGLRVRTSPEPHAAPGEVRIRVTAAGLNPVDLRIAEGGTIAARFGAVPPYVNGNDFAGVIDEVGEGVSGWSVGDRVYGGARCRAQSQYLVLAPDDLIRTPADLPDQVAAALDIAARTAWAGIHALAVGPGETIAISAAAGGCGLFAVQFAVQAGARVIGLAREPNHRLLREYGAIPLSYRGDVLSELRCAAPEGVDAFFDAHGGEYPRIARELGVRAERINSVADREGARAVGGISVGRATTTPRSLEPLGAMAADGRLRVHIDGVFPIEKAHEAYAALADGHVRGKLVLDLS